MVTDDRQAPVVTIDGPSGSGKGTLASSLADALGWRLLDSGALYRVVATAALREGIDLADEAALAALVRRLDIQFAAGRCSVDSRDVTDEIRTEEAGVAASKVAQLGAVRDAVFHVQRSFRTRPGLVADGRDMGTVVFPDAKLKIFLEASAGERAGRRYKQLKNKGLSVSLRGLLGQIQERDARDRGRAIAPLKPADDAVVLDSTQMSIEEVFTEVMKLVRTSGLKDMPPER